MGTLEWTESSQDENVGVDHLGMRVANESAYSRLIDFTTTVTWRPRYFSFLCYAAQKAFLRNGGDFDKNTSKVNRNGYQRTLRQMEYGLVAASLVIDSNTSKVAGTDKVSLALDDLKNGNVKELVLKGNHLQASTGGLSIYAGVMRALGLLSSSESIDLPLPGTPGDALAQAFARSLAISGLESPLEKQSHSLEELERIGECCALNGLEEQAHSSDLVSQERDLIRSVIFDWENFKFGNGRSASRILSLGLMLESRNLYPDREATLGLFREFTLLSAANCSGKIVPLELPQLYTKVLLEWQMYQVHAYITFALESLLSLVLAQAKELQEEQGDKIQQANLVNSLVALIPQGHEDSPSTLPAELNQWWALGLEELTDSFQTMVDKQRDFPLCEPELFTSINGVAKSTGSANMAGWAHDTFLMFLMAIVRMRHFLKIHGDNVWIGTEQGFRLTPGSLSEHYGKALDSNTSVLEYLRKVVCELVIKQHHQNALRKLIAQPDKDTAKFILEGSYFIPVGTHSPGTSSPRYENALLFLQDLGLLTRDTKPKVTPDGNAILDKIRGGGL